MGMAALLITAAEAASQPLTGNAVSQQRVSLDYRGETLWNIFRDISRQTKINFVLDHDVQDISITIYLAEVSLDDALAAIAEIAGLRYEQRGVVKFVFLVPS
jgi:uncharacterized membrane protein YjjP (DUF1212 family)